MEILNLIIKNSTIKSIKGECLEFNGNIEFENCTIESISLHGIKVNKLFSIINCKILNFADFSGSIFETNQEHFIFHNNRFENIVTFEDCNFKSCVKITENIFLKGSDLNTKKQLGCYYPKKESIIINNEGNLELSEIEENKIWEKIRKTLPNTV